MKQLFNKLALNPKRLFLIDGLGALLTALLLFAILRTFNEYFGMPKTTLIILSIIALLFCFYSFCCFFFVNNNWHPFLRAIIVANILYSCLTLGLVIYNFPRLTILGVIYFLVEIVVVGGLIFFEINVLTISNRKRHPDFQI